MVVHAAEVQARDACAGQVVLPVAPGPQYTPMSSALVFRRGPMADRILAGAWAAAGEGRFRVTGDQARALRLRS